jgi:2-hydroxy-6-oxonona-2,4-dienedioate hydrolase
MQDNYVSVRGVRTRYLSAGRGAPLLLLHGIGLSADCFLENIDALGERHAVYAVDLLGHGFTDAVDFRGVAPQVVMAQHIAAFARELGLPPHSIIGSSFGAHVAAHAYLAASSTVTHLVLVGSGSIFHSSDEQKKTLAGSFANGSRAMKDPTIESCYERLSKIVIDPTCIPNELLVAQVASYQLPDRLAAYEAAINGSIATMDDSDARVLGRLEELACPTEVIVGRDDIRADWKVHVNESARIPNSQVKIYEQCGHLPFLEHADQFNRDVDVFLAS